MSEEHPPDDLEEAAQAELDLDDPPAEETAADAHIDAADQPAAQNGDSPPANDHPAAEGEQAASGPRDDLNENGGDAGTIDEPEPNAAPRSVLTGPVPPPAPAASAGPTQTPVLPTAWPDPIPVTAPEPDPRRLQGLMITPPIAILGGLMTIAFVMFVAIEPTPRWLLLFAAVIAVLGTDGALRQTWPRPFAGTGDAADSTPYLFLPALAAIAAPMLIEHNVRGYLVLPAALLAGAAFTVVIVAQVSSVRVGTPVYPLARLISTAAVYFAAFTLFSLSYVLDVELPAAVVAVGVVGAMLGVELFREGQVDPLETLLFAVVTGVIVGEARWAMYYIPAGGYLAGLALLLAFFLVTGLLHSHLTRRLNRAVTLEYGGIAAAGVLLVVIASQAGLG